MVEDREVESAEALGIGEEVDRDDLLALTVKPPTENTRPSRVETRPAAPLITLGEAQQ